MKSKEVLSQEERESACQWCMEHLGSALDGRIWSCPEDGASGHWGCAREAGRCLVCSQEIEKLTRIAESGEVFGTPVEEAGVERRGAALADEEVEAALSGRGVLTRAIVMRCIEGADPLERLREDLAGKLRFNFQDLLRIGAGLVVFSQMWASVIWIAVESYEPWLETQIKYSVMAMGACLFFILFLTVISKTAAYLNPSPQKEVFQFGGGKLKRNLSQSDYHLQELFERRLVLSEEILALAESAQFGRRVELCQGMLNEFLSIQKRLERYDRERFPKKDHLR